MGSSKVIIVGAMAVVIGLFGVNLKDAERKSAKIAEAQAYQLQAKMLADQGLNMAVRRLPHSLTAALPNPSYHNTKEGTLVFVISNFGLPTDQRRISSYGIVNDVWVVQTTIVKKLPPGVKSVKKSWNGWELVSITRSKPQYTTLNII